MVSHNLSVSECLIETLNESDLLGSVMNVHWTAGHQQGTSYHNFQTEMGLFTSGLNLIDAPSSLPLKTTPIELEGLLTTQE